MSIQLRDGLLNQKTDRVLEDLLVRFLINVPDEDLSSIERVFFQVEEAQWFYTDFVKQLNPYLPGMKMKSFAPKFLEKCPLIWKWGDPSDAITRFGKYKSTIPVRGVALFNKDLTKVVLVQGTESSTWSFPRGKISKDESDIDCAAREVEEETGFDARGLINEQDVVERTIKGKNYKIYLVKNVPEDYNFQPLARGEISKIEWFDIKQIQKKSRNNPNTFFIVGTVLKPMLKWINKNKEGASDDEIMYDVEVKLKNLLGINRVEEENVDAGRELLNILQKVTINKSNYDVPQNLLQFPAQPPNFQHSPYAPPPGHPAFMMHPPVPPPFFPQFQPTNPINYPSDPNFIPNPQTLAKPRRSSDSKELLSILNKPKKKAEDPKVNTISEDQESNRSKAQHLLSLFNSEGNENAQQTLLSILNKKKPENASQTSQEPQGKENPSQTLLGILNSKKEERKEETPSQTLMNILNKKEPTSSPSSQILRGTHPSSNELEESIRFNDNISQKGKIKLLKREKPEEQLQPISHTSSQEQPSPVPSTVPSSRSYGSKELLSLLKGPKIESPKQSSQASPRTKPKSTASQELLGLLNRKPKEEKPIEEKPIEEKPIEEKAPVEKAPVENAEGEFEDFEDFEDFGALNQDFLGKSSYENFDIASDEEDVDHLLDDLNTSNYNKPPDFYKKDEPKKNKIRLVKPGESLDEILGEKPESSGSNAQGQSLLALLNSKKPAQDQPNDFQFIYGAPNSPVPLNLPQNHNANSSEVLKDLLWKR